MENFDWTKFTLRIPVNATLHQLYDAWAKPANIEAWFLSDASYTDDNGQTVDKHSRVKRGDTYAWQWHTYDLTEHGTITQANGTDFFQFTFAGECLVDVRLIPYKDQVIVELTQYNISTDDKSKRDYRLGCHDGWSFFLVNLKSVYEGGLDLRNKDTELKQVVNA